ncbi:MAG: hypothetical protein CVV23_05125 [Ignavibacteriae bacterium HGW-Ignavibacteriae-2]|nr:MAG: hypothetical protein CVV23_05125 [Ignavibacteriae bacterium HGW-Ignavibacteriae-2]
MSPIKGILRMKNKIDRKKFFVTASLSAFGLTLLNNTPLKYFNNNKNGIEKKITLNIHPSAVKRNK